VDGTLLEAWASAKSFKPKQEKPFSPPDDPGNPTVNFRGERRSNETHESKTDGEALLARKGEGKETIKREVVTRFGYDLERKLDDIRPRYEFNESCQETVPEAIIAFLESQDYVDAVRKAVSLGGDADTLAAITGAIAEAYYGGVPPEIAAEVGGRVPAALWKVIEEFSRTYAARAA
jgi:ADP-ribosylglycohydrolase